MSTVRNQPHHPLAPSSGRRGIGSWASPFDFPTSSPSPAKEMDNDQPQVRGHRTHPQWLEISLVRRTDGLVIAELTHKTGRGGEMVLADPAGYRQDLSLDGFKVLFGPDGVDRLVVGEAIKRQAHRSQLHLFLRGQGVNGELQALVGILLRAGPAGLVVNQFDGALALPRLRGQGTNLVDAAFQPYFAQVQ